MARANNFLLGQGERLTKAHLIPRSRKKVAPYEYPYARDRLLEPADALAQWASGLPDDACPRDQVVAELILHPRYLSKSDAGGLPLDKLGFKVVGRRPVTVTPEQWGTKSGGGSAVSDQLYVVSKRADLLRLPDRLKRFGERDSETLAQIEMLSPFSADEKLIDLPETGDFLAEVVLHNAGDPRSEPDFLLFAKKHGFDVLRDRSQSVGWLSFLPVALDGEEARTLARYSLVRAVRRMPTLRSMDEGDGKPTLVPVTLPAKRRAKSRLRAVIFDGGIPQPIRSSLEPWVTLIEPDDIAAPAPHWEAHGLAVTSSFLFGPVEDGTTGLPPCPVDHVRVLDHATSEYDTECYDVLDRIVRHLQTHPDRYQFANISLGPDRSIKDHEVTLWTARLDTVLAPGKILTTVAVGNGGKRDSEHQLDRLQPPSDGVNVFSIGSATSRGAKWDRAPYSCVGLGRCPGIFKPDGIVFGGAEAGERFGVLGGDGFQKATYGTSVASAFGLRTCVEVADGASGGLQPLAVRALMIHRAERKLRSRHRQVGWGRLRDDVNYLLTCDDCESLVIYQGHLPVGEHLRVPVAVPGKHLKGTVSLSATLVISPDVDPEQVSTYTRAGLTVTFRPDAKHHALNEKKVLKREPETDSFFSAQKLKGRISEAVLRKEAYKWEPVLHATRTFEGETLVRPFFDVYYNHRQRGTAQPEPQPIPYALLITLRAEDMPRLYQDTLTAYASILTPLTVSPLTLRNR